LFLQGKREVSSGSFIESPSPIHLPCCGIGWGTARLSAVSIIELKWIGFGWMRVGVRMTLSIGMWLISPSCWVSLPLGLLIWFAHELLPACSG
jgi:hypothetical protein